jgi:hypothetical protein
MVNSDVSACGQQLPLDISQPFVKINAQAERLSSDRGARALTPIWSCSDARVTCDYALSDNINTSSMAVEFHNQNITINRHLQGTTIPNSFHHETYLHSHCCPPWCLGIHHETLSQMQCCKHPTSFPSSKMNQLTIPQRTTVHALSPAPKPSPL